MVTPPIFQGKSGYQRMSRVFGKFFRFLSPRIRLCHLHCFFMCSLITSCVSFGSLYPRGAPCLHRFTACLFIYGFSVPLIPARDVTVAMHCNPPFTRLNGYSIFVRRYYDSNEHPRESLRTSFCRCLCSVALFVLWLLHLQLQWARILRACRERILQTGNLFFLLLPSQPLCGLQLSYSPPKRNQRR